MTARVLALVFVVTAALASDSTTDAPALVPGAMEPGTTSADGVATAPPAEQQEEIQRLITELKEGMAEGMARQDRVIEDAVKLADRIKAEALKREAEAEAIRASSQRADKTPVVMIYIILFEIISGVAFLAAPTYRSWYGIIQGYYLIYTLILSILTLLKEHGRLAGSLSTADLVALQLGACLVRSEECRRLSGIAMGVYCAYRGLYLAWLTYMFHDKL